jgi:uncharacterized membrane protein
MNPFDWRTVLLAKHAQHVALIHFPIALFIAAVALDLLGVWAKREDLATAGYINLSLAALSVFPAILTGLVAWHWQLEGHRLKGVLLWHLLAASCSAVIIWASWWIHYRTRRGQRRSVPRWRVVLELAGVLVVALTGHLGGFLSGVNTNL